MAIVHQIHTDVLVVGGGGAALRAAIEARDANAKVLLVTKGTLGQSGATAYPVADVAGLAVADGRLDPTDTPDLHLLDILEAGMGMNDETLSRILAMEAPQTIPDLERWGVDFEHDDQGNYLITQACFSSHPRNYKLSGHGTKIVQALKKQVAIRPIDVLENAMLLDVTMTQDRVVGGIVLDEKGQLYAIHAKAVILGTGGAGQLFQHSANPSDVTGDGYAIGFRAGALLFNMEYIQYGIGTLPSINVFAFWLWSFAPDMLNGQFEEVLSKYLPDGITPKQAMYVHGHHFPFTNRLISRAIEIAAHKEATGEHPSPHGGVYLDFRGKLYDSDEITDTTRKLWHTTDDYYQSKGINLHEVPVEVACYAHAMNGGLRTDEFGESTIRGLFAVGETAGGPHGADRLGGGMLTACQVFGKRAGIKAAQYHNEDIGEIDKVYIEEFVREIEGIKGRDQKGEKPEKLRKEMQELSTQYLLLLRTEEKCEQYEIALDSMEKRVEAMSICSNKDLMHYFELKNLLLVGRIICCAAKERKETRGSHVREDYPQTDDEAKWILVSRDQNGNPFAYKTPVSKTIIKS